MKKPLGGGAEEIPMVKSALLLTAAETENEEKFVFFGRPTKSMIIIQIYFWFCVQKSRYKIGRESSIK